MLNTSSQTLAKWENCCWNRQGICDPLSLSSWPLGLHFGTHTDLFSTKDAAFHRCEGSGMRTLALINPLPLLEGSLPNSPLKEMLQWSHPCVCSTATVAWWCDCLWSDTKHSSLDRKFTGTFNNAVLDKYLHRCTHIFICSASTGLIQVLVLKYKQWGTAVVMTSKIQQLFVRAENCSSNKK